LVERGGRVGGDRRDGERVDEADRTHQLLHPSQLALVLRVGELDDQARRRSLCARSHTHARRQPSISATVGPLWLQLRLDCDSTGVRLLIKGY